MDTKFDCDHELNDPRYEKYCQLRAQGLSQKDSYLQAGFAASETSVHASASRLEKRPEIKARIRSLQMQSVAGVDGELTTQEIKAKLIMLFRTSASADSIKALQQLRDEFGILDELKADRVKVRPDPCAIISYITGFAGRKGDEIVQELGGREFIESQLCAILKVESVTIGEPVRQ